MILQEADGENVEFLSRPIIELDEWRDVTFQDVRLSIDSKNNACIKIKEAPIICVCPCVKNVFDCYSPLGSMSKRYQHLRSLGTLDISGFNCRSSTIFKFQPCSEATAATCPAHKGDSFRIRNAPNHSVALKRK